MSEAGLVAIMVATITGIPAIVAAVLANRGRQHAKAARVQVENDHTTNFREDHDKQADQLSLGLRLLLSAKSDIRGLRRDIGRIYDRLDQHEAWIHEDTETREERKRHERQHRTDTRQHPQRFD